MAEEDEARINTPSSAADSAHTGTGSEMEGRRVPEVSLF